MFPQLLPQGPLPQLAAMRQPIDLEPRGAFSARGSSRTYGNDIDIGELQSWARSDMDRWDLRNSRMQKHQDMYRLAPPLQVPRNRSLLVTLNDPRTLVEKITRILARHPNLIDVPVAPGVEPQIAQKMENALYAIDRAVNARWIAALNNPYRWDQAFSAVLRGWICERTMFNPAGASDLSRDPAALWDHQIVEPACVYPYKAGGTIRRVTHSYQTSVGDLCRDPMLQPFLDPDWYDQDERSLCHVTAIYWQALDGGWYHAILGGVGPGSGLAGNSGLWIKAPMELGYNPWTIVLCGGAGYRETPWDDQEFIEDVGAGVLASTDTNQKHLDRMVTRLNELLAQESNPAITVYTNSGELKTVEMQAGSRNYLAREDKVELHRMGPEVRDFQMLWDIFKERAARGGLSDAFFADRIGDGQQNGLAAAQALAASRDVLHPYAEGINAADSLKYQKMLEQYRDFGPGVAIPSKITPGNGMLQGLQQMSQSVSGEMGMPGMQSPLGGVMQATLDVWEIIQQGTYVEITREDMTPMEIAARINLAMGMVDKQIISRDTARKDYAKLRNPGAENTKILAEAVYQDPMLIKALLPMTLSDTGQNQLRQFWEMLQNQVPAQMGQPGQVQPQDVSHGQLPTQVTAPAAQGDPMTNVRTAQVDPVQAMMEQLMSGMNGNAQGGTGAGGTPPQWSTGMPNRGTPASRGF